MCNWKNWIWPGLLAVALLTALAMLMRADTIEADLTAKANSGLAAGHGWASVALDGRDLTLTGVAPSEEAAAEALAIAENAYDVRIARSQTELLPLANPFTLSAVKSASGITLEGNTPDEATGSALAAAAAAVTAGSVTNNLVVARGAPAGFSDLAGFAIGQLGGLSDGTMALSGSGLTASGTAQTLESYEEVTSALAGTLPGGGNLVSADIARPVIDPFIFSATRGEDGGVVSGFVPDEDTRQSVLQRARDVIGGNITDQLVIARGAPAGFGALAGFGIDRLADLSTGEASLSGLNLTVRGTANSPEAYDSVTAALAGEIPSDGRVVIADITRSTVSPYTLSARKQAGSVVLEGYVGSAGEKEDLAAYAQALNPTFRIIDRLKVANGAPSGVDWPEAAKFAVAGASRLSSGAASLNNDGYSISGIASSNANYDAIKAGGLPANVALVSDTVTRPVADPYVWSFVTGEDAAPSMSGFLPDEATVETASRLISETVGTSQALVNNVELAGGAPRDLDAALSVAINTASRLANGRAEIEGTRLFVAGEALSEEAAGQVRTQVENGLPPGYSGTHDITVRQVASVPVVTPDECQSILTESLRNNSIRFETASAVIRTESYALLDRLAFVTRRCPDARVEIGGHTDSDGSDSYNQGLSEERANAVRAWLIRAGVAEPRLTARGYGETRPVADNETPEGKAANRRIEFTVIR